MGIDFQLTVFLIIAVLLLLLVYQLGRGKIRWRGFAVSVGLLAILGILVNVAPWKLSDTTTKLDTLPLTRDVSQFLDKLDSKSTASKKSKSKVGSVSSLTDGLQQRLEKNPDDGGGWLLLARSYLHMGNKTAAYDAYAKASTLGNNDSDLALRIGKLDAGVSAAGFTDHPFAISGTLTALPEAQDAIPDTATIYIIVKADNGTAMPVAVSKHKASELPIDFSLDQSNIMMRGQDVSKIENMVVTARVSPDGNATNSLAAIVSSEVQVTKEAFGLNLVLKLTSDE